jgi:phage shock protein PspC (stress-responsive transcriptional regulator)
MIVGIVFGALAIGALTYLVYALMAPETTASFVGGAHLKHR